jgi:hypothetical protein
MLEQTIGSAEIYTLPPPEDFDPLTATAQDLKHYGLPKRPDYRTEDRLSLCWVRL